jgi:hypothetical protein
MGRWTASARYRIPPPVCSALSGGPSLAAESRVMQSSFMAKVRFRKPILLNLARITGQRPTRICGYAVGIVATTLALSGCGGADGQCVATCSPACAAGTICSADIHGHTSAVWHGVCLELCSRPTDCSGELRCRSFGGTAPFVCASDTMPVLCDPNATYRDDAVADFATCVDAQTLAATFGTTTKNETGGHELQTCASGCEETTTATGARSARCR